MWSLCLGLIMCFLSVLPACFDHGERKRGFNVAVGFRAKLVTGLRWILINWGLPALAFSVTVAQGLESAATDEELRISKKTIATLATNLSGATQQLAQLEIKTRPKPLKERLVEFLNSREPQLLSKLSNSVGGARFEWAASIPDVGILQGFLREPEGQKYMELYVLDLQFVTTQTGTMIQQHKLDLRLKPELIK